MKTLNVIVNDVVTILDKVGINSGNVNSIKCSFVLPESFNGLVPIAAFSKNRSSP